MYRTAWLGVAVCHNFPAPQVNGHKLPVTWRDEDDPIERPSIDCHFENAVPVMQFIRQP